MKNLAIDIRSCTVDTDNIGDHLLVIWGILKELQLQGAKIRNGVVLSRYSQNNRFLNNLSIF